ncbi:MAG TPA: 30S ribosomal protein S3 [Candidatus Nanoarchaeia archaeon]|nr:30S ribosomal protein S3 [Candidatus Nanoarchaeia archaeon]
MIERKFISEKMKEFSIQEHISENLHGVGHSKTKVVRTPLGEKIIVYVSRPGLIVGKKGANIKQLTKTLKKTFNLENPQIEISEVENPVLDAAIVAETIADSLERLGTAKFKAIGHKVMTDAMNAGALGIEILISGKIPSSRAKSWRFYQGYLKKCGDVALTGVRAAHSTAHLKTGAIGVKVKIMPPETQLPDKVTLLEEGEKQEEPKAEPAPKEEQKKAEEKPKRKRKKKEAKDAGKSEGTKAAE